MWNANKQNFIFHKSDFTLCIITSYKQQKLYKQLKYEILLLGTLVFILI